MIYAGIESITDNFQDTGKTIGDFWSWAYSDLLNNITRGRFGEFIVATALDAIDANTFPDTTFGSCDLLWHGIRIEVKTSSIWQSWSGSNGRGPGNISFRIAPARIPDERGDYKDNSPLQRNSDIYVFCVFAPEMKDASPLQMENWQFYVIPTATLDEKCGKQKTIGFSSLLKLNPVLCSYSQLKDAVTSLVRSNSFISRGEQE